MKRVLVVGDDSYIALQFKKYAEEKCTDIFEIKMVNSRDETWQQADFNGYTTLLFCAGIAHQKRIKKELYYKINCDLTRQVAEKAKRENITQFIFLSSMAVYGNKITAISHTTPPNPNPTDYYALSKLDAELALNALADDDFNISIVRPPMVYGEGCKGNYPRLVALANALPIFPNYKNQRSMIYIDNLSAFICDLIINKKSGICLPQDENYISTFDMVKKINPRIRGVKWFNPLIKVLSKRVGILNKLFGDLYYLR